MKRTDNYTNLGLATKPNTGDNDVHASTSPFEAMAERHNWLGHSIEQDNFWKGLLAFGITMDTIHKWKSDLQVTLIDHNCYT